MDAYTKTPCQRGVITANKPCIIMMTTKKWPLVPSGCTIPGYGSSYGSGATRGAKNLWKRQSCHTQMNIATFNTRTLRLQAKLEELEKDLEQVNWDILGLSEVKRKGEDKLKLQSGNVLFYTGDSNSAIGSVGFLIHRRIVGHVTEMRSISPRVAYIVLSINKRYSLRIVQGYAPTSGHSDVESELFYEDVDKALSQGPRTQFNIIMGDFNARLGCRTIGEVSVGPFGYGTRNRRGQAFANFLEERRLYAMNTFFVKNAKRKWTWASPDGKTKSEYDYICTDNKQIVTDVTVIKKLKMSDHRLVRSTIRIDTRLERKKLLRNPLANLHIPQGVNKEYKQKLAQGLKRPLIDCFEQSLDDKYNYEYYLQHS
ncbi:craniofacial development protein 2-like [Achroia grisella]|uniref:craniofacial development protein 2-like n=1 Tax=Achroia grisella TaxID=688607 RepID=UPI0027D3086C|nr:craniofacial development protein 2-like [Achroia grisella]